jgi:ABC-type sugar transport system ATPase subunit
MAMQDCLLKIKGLALEFSGTPILKSVDLSLNEGEIHALVGENGAGKSSLFKCILGIISPSQGEIIFLNESLLGHSIREVLQKGISMIHQELMLIPELTVAENIFLGRESMAGKRMGLREINQATTELFQEYDLDISVGAFVKDLSIAHQQIIEIMRSVSQKARLILMDEPTSSLTEKEITFFKQLIFRLKTEGISIVFTSHKMDEVFDFSDKISVLRDGEMVGTFTKEEVNPMSLVQKMVGREMKDFYPTAEFKVGEQILKVEELSCLPQFEKINFSLCRGEVLGLSGLVGAGRSDIGQVIFGVKKKTSGKMYLKGIEFNPKNPSDALQAGFGYLGEDRKEMGIIPEMNITENMSLGLLDAGYRKLCFIDEEKENSDAMDMQGRLSVHSAKEGQRIQNLSGGNQQKVLFGRILLNNPEVLILDEPTRGIDVMSKFEIYTLILSLKKQGKAILLISSDLPELLAMSDRVIVISKGKQMVEMTREEASPEQVLAYALH